jgi:hypothetical protein
MLERHRDDLQHLELPKGRPISKSWVQHQMKALRSEIEKSDAARF